MMNRLKLFYIEHCLSINHWINQLTILLLTLY